MTVLERLSMDALAEPPLTIRPMSIGSLRSSDDWDCFAQACGMSYYCARAYILPHRLTHRLHLFEVFAGPEKIAQCALAALRVPGRSRRIFLDAIQLKPEHRGRWTEVMKALLSRLGPGQYAYGSVWNAESPRDDVLQGLAGVTLVNSEGWRVMSVDFTGFMDWDHYHRSMSTNAKRNAAKAAKADPDIRIETEAGFPRPTKLKRIMALRQGVFQRKGLAIQFWRLTLLRRLIMLRRHISVSWVHFQGRYTSYALCLRWGSDLYYTDGASVSENGGSAWFLLTEVIRAHQRACPAGKFVMGFDPVKPWGGDTRRWDNLLRQRQQCRADSAPTTIVVFDYRTSR